MISKQDILFEIYDKYGEWLEMAGEDSPAYVIDILCQMLIKEREKNLFKRNINNKWIT